MAAIWARARWRRPCRLTCERLSIHAGKAGDDAWVASTVDVADFAVVVALFPLGKRDGAQRTVGRCVLEDVFVLLGGGRPIAGACEPSS